jgi:NAD-specific glutamate dehydrogenase
MKGKAVAQAAAFVRGLYASMPPADVADHSVEALHGMAVSLWKFSQQRNGGALAVRVLDAAIDGKLGRKAVDGLIETWLQSHAAAIRQVNDLMEKIRAEPELDQATLTMANGQLRALVYA